MDKLQVFLHHLALWDAICLTVLAVSALVGLWRGLTREVMALAAWVIAFFGAQWGAVAVQPMLPLAWRTGWSPQASYLLAFALVFVVLLLLVGMVGGVMRLWIRQVGLGVLDRLLGLGFGALRALVLLWVVTVVVLLTPLQTETWWRQSQASALLVGSLQAVAPLLPPAFAEWLPEHVRAGPPRVRQQV